MRFHTSKFLRRVLFVDAATCIATGALLISGSTILEQTLGLPGGLLRYAGATLLPFAAFLIYLGSRGNVAPSGVWTVIVLNALWTLDSFLLVMTGWVSPTELGYLVVSAQAVGVAVLAVLEYVGLKKSAADLNPARS